MNYFLDLKKKIKIKKAKICVVGLGYVGSSLIKKLEKSGFETIGIDVNLKKIKKNFKNSKIFLTKDYRYINSVDIIILALPTPLHKNLTPDLSMIKDSMESMQEYLKAGQLISLESSTYPGTTEEIIGSYLLKKNFDISKNFFLIYSPERINPEIKIKGITHIKYNLENTPKICAGFSEKCASLGFDLYKNITNKVIKAGSLKAAETAKIVENIFRSVNISLVNELKMFLNKINIDIHEVLDLAGTKPFGYKRFDPGPGYGGHCVPLDPYYLYWLGKKNNFELKFVKTSGEINRNVVNWITKKILNFINKKKIINFNKKILILGVAYKRNIDDIRESPALIIAEKLRNKGIGFEYSDPHVNKIFFQNKLKKSKIVNANLLKRFPIVVIVTDHAKFNYNLISSKAKYLFDCRNSIKNRKDNYYKI